MSQVVGWLVAVGLVVCAVLVQGSLISSENGPEIFQPVTLTVNSFKMCPDHMNLPSTFDNLSLFMDPENEHILFVDGFLNMKKDIPVGAKMIVDIRRCYNEREESCEKTVVHEIEDFCSHIHQKGMMWSDFVSHTEGFPATCPLTAGSYMINEAPLDLSELQNHANRVLGTLAG